MTDPASTTVSSRPPFLDDRTLRAVVTDKSKGRSSRLKRLGANIRELDQAGKHREAALAAFFRGCIEISDEAARSRGIVTDTLRAQLDYLYKNIVFDRFTIKDLRLNAPETFRALSCDLHLRLTHYMQAAIPSNEKFGAYAERVEEAVAQTVSEDAFQKLREELLEQIAGA